MRPEEEKRKVLMEGQRGDTEREHKGWRVTPQCDKIIEQSRMLTNCLYHSFLPVPRWGTEGTKIASDFNRRKIHLQCWNQRSLDWESPDQDKLGYKLLTWIKVNVQPLGESRMGHRVYFPKIISLNGRLPNSFQILKILQCYYQWGFRHQKLPRRVQERCCNERYLRIKISIHGGKIWWGMLCNPGPALNEPWPMYTSATWMAGSLTRAGSAEQSSRSASHPQAFHQGVPCFLIDAVEIHDDAKEPLMGSPVSWEWLAVVSDLGQGSSTSRI